jgi:hypothetical protein
MNLKFPKKRFKKGLFIVGQNNFDGRNVGLA